VQDKALHVPGIICTPVFIDARHKAGHDGSLCVEFFLPPLEPCRPNHHISHAATIASEQQRRSRAQFTSSVLQYPKENRKSEQTTIKSLWFANVRLQIGKRLYLNGDGIFEAQSSERVSKSGA
jgi:hypothetical protein